MRFALSGLFAAAALFAGAARGAEPASAAQTRASLYQREVRLALARHGWSITRDEAGKFTAEHRWIPRNGATGFVIADQGQSTFARLQIGFQPDGKDHTNAAARASLCIYSSPSVPEATYLAYPPLALRDPKLTQEYLDILAEADSRLTASHQPTIDSKKVAVR